jgi:uncharacterized protein YjbJ (UPF0337 family)
MINQATLQGNWNEIKGQLRKHWGQLTNDELQTFNGNVDQLVGLIQRKTGEARSQVEEFLDELTSNGSASLSDAADNVREYVQQACSSVSCSAPVSAAVNHKRPSAAYNRPDHFWGDTPFCLGAGS